MDLIFIVLGVAAVVLVGLGVRTVPQGYEYTVERFGRYTKSIKPGLNLIIPVVDQIGNRVNLMEQTIDIPAQNIITKDNATAKVNGIMYAKVLETEKAAYGVTDLIAALSNLSMTNIRSVLGEYNLDDALSNRDEINAKLLNVLDAAAEPWGTKITRVEIQEIEPSQDLLDAMGSQMKAEREKRADVLRAEGKKQATILEAEGRQIAAEKDANARERLAKAEAEATRVVSEAIESGDANALNYFVAQKYTEAMQAIGTSTNHKIVLMPMEATNLIGSLGGVKELLGKINNTDK